MLRALLWKEWREQASILVALVALGAGVVATAVQFGGPITDASPFDLRSYGEAGRLALVMLALTTGTVVGGALFAGEREEGTHEFLDALPATRWRVWRGKVAAGFVLAFGAGSVLIAAGVAAGALGSGRYAAGWAVWVLTGTLAAYGWGVVGSAMAKSTLSACGLGLVAGMFGGTALMLVAAVVLNASGRQEEYGSRRGGELFFLALGFLQLALPFPLSGLIYSAPDRARRNEILTPNVMKTSGRTARRARRFVGGFWPGALAWLLFRQYLVPVLVLGGLALALGGVMLIDPVQPVFAWPGGAVMLGVLVGVIGWSDEQGRGASRFWGERRMPPGRLWLAKLLAGGAITLFLCVLALAPLAIRAAVSDRRGPALEAFHSALLFEMGYRTIYFLLLWPVYGYAFGHLAGLLFRKAVVAAGVGVMTGGVAAALWLPSLLGGGVHHWQLWPVPVVVLLTARLLMRPWAADTIGSKRSVYVMAGGGLAALLLAAAGIGYRVLEVEPVAWADDDIAFAKSVPSYEQNEAGREIRRAISLYRQSTGRSLDAPPTPLFPDETPRNWFDGQMFRVPAYKDQLGNVLRYGYPANRPDLDEWMDKQFPAEWVTAAAAAAKFPPGPVTDPTTLNVLSPDQEFDALLPMCTAMLARGLQLQARGDHEAFPDHLAAALTVARNAKFKSLAVYVFTAFNIERAAASATTRWLENAPARPPLLAKVAKLLETYDATAPTDPTSTWLAERTVCRTSVNAPSLWVAKYLAIFSFGRSAAENEEFARTEANLVAFAWIVPWEKERHRRLVGLGNDDLFLDDVLDLADGAVGGRGRVVRSVFGMKQVDLTRGDSASRAFARGAMLTAAVRAFEAGEGRVPTTLSELVPKYLAAVPTDPFDQAPFKYRISPGEKMAVGELPEPPPVFGPGNDGLLQLTQDEFDAAAAVAGGLVRFPMEMRPPPGLDGVNTDDEFDAFAAVMGGGVQWPLDPLTKASLAVGGRFPEGESPGLPPTDKGWGGRFGGFGPPGAAAGGMAPFQLMSGRRAGPPPPDRKKYLVVPAGRPVVYSVGVNQTDDGGGYAKPDADGPGVYFGDDIIFVVPKAK